MFILDIPEILINIILGLMIIHYVVFLVNKIKN